MPGMYSEGEYDIAGFTVGVVDKSKIVNGSRIAPGDTVIGLASSGVHSNGFSLVRKLLLEEAGYALTDKLPELDGEVLGDVLLTPTKLYVKPVLSLLEQVDVKGMAHITGGGFIENIPRVLPEGVDVEIAYGSWPILPIFDLLQKQGNVSPRDMFTTFNMGIGLVIVVAEDQVEQAIAALQQAGETPYVIGKATEGQRVVTFAGADV